MVTTVAAVKLLFSLAAAKPDSVAAVVAVEAVFSVACSSRVPVASWLLELELQLVELPRSTLVVRLAALSKQHPIADAAVVADAS